MLWRVVRNGLSRSTVPLRLLLPYLLLALCVLVSGLNWSTDTYGQQKTIRFLTLTTLSFAAVPAVISSELDFRIFLIAVIALSVLMVVFGRTTPEGLSAFGATHITAGRIVGLGIIACSYLFIRPAGWLVRRLPWLLVAALLIAGLLSSGSRGSLVSLLGTGALVAGVTLAIRRGRRYLLTATALLITTVAAISFIMPAAVETMNQRLTRTLSGPLTVTARTRTERAAVALEQFFEHPLTGGGIGSFSSSYGQPDSVRGDYPHNILLEVASELGLIGLAALVLLLLSGLNSPVRMLRAANHNTAITLTLLAITGYFLFNALFSGDLNDNRLLFSALALASSRWAASTG
ncbi:MAG: O-antigen ligase family protein [candidate division WOR-3 bacterium]